MVKRSPWRVAVLLLGLWLLPALPAQAGIIPDPVGDTFGTGPVQIDLTGTEVAGGPVTTRITLTFASAVAAPSAFAPNSVVGFIDLDVPGQPKGTAPWGMALTGGNNWINFFVPPNPGTPSIPGPTVNLNDSFFVDLGSESSHPGLVDVVRTTDNSVVGVAPIIYAGTTVQIFMPSALIGTPPGLNYGVLVGTFSEPTDRAPNGATGLAATPEPSTLALAGAAGLGALAFRLRRRKAGA
jgi:hypothetical protein